MHPLHIIIITWLIASIILSYMNNDRLMIMHSHQNVGWSDHPKTLSELAGFLSAGDADMTIEKLF